MQIDRTPQELLGPGINRAMTEKPESSGLDPSILDSITLGPAGDDDALVNMFNLREAAIASPAMHTGAPSSIMFLAAPPSMKDISFPGLSSSMNARNDVPVVIVHGTMASEKSIQKYKDAVLAEGHPADIFTYLSIKEGEPLEKSGQLISEHVNTIRMSVARRHLEKLAPFKDDLEGLKKALLMRNDLYGSKDEKVDKVAALVPGLIDKLQNVLKGDEKDLTRSFSGKTRELEAGLSTEIRKTGFAGGDKQIAGKVAAEIMDSIAPKAALIGHSMGGFVSYAMALNPKGKGDKNDIFHYDAGNGISTVITLSSPVGKGVKKPLPKGLENMMFDLADKNMLQPMENTPGMQLSELNPFFNMWYSSSKAMMREAYRQSMIIGATMSNPMVYLMKPGVEEISEGSSFIKNYVQDKKIPDGVTIIAASNKEDGISEQDRSQVDESQPNAYNFDAKVTITAEDMKDPMAIRPAMAHIKMAQYPFEHGEEFRQEVLENPKQIPRLLDRSNYDGIRWKCLATLSRDLDSKPDLFESPEFKPALEKIRDVAAESLPFTDSPSFIAKQILLKLNEWKA
jgi:hypothetical protein